MRRAARVVVVIFATAGCHRVATEKLDLGAEVSKAEVNRALAAAMRGITADHVRAGQGVSYVTTRRLGDSGAEATLGAATMSTVADPSRAGALRLIIDTTARAETGQMKTTRAERTLTLDLVAARAAEDARTEPAPAPAPATRVSYHRLRTAEEVVRAPSTIRARENCNGLPRCEFTVRYVLFEVVAVTDGAAPQRTSITLGFSPQTPYLPYGEGFDRFNGALIQDCRAANVSVDGHRVTVTDCKRLIDFQKD